MNKREALKLMTTGLVSTAFLPTLKAKDMKKPIKLNGNIHHSASRWCYQTVPLDELCDFAVSLGMEGIDLLKPSEWETVLDKGLQCSMVNPEEFSLEEGFNDPSLHGDLQKTYFDLIDLAADAGIRNVICFSGNRREGLSEKEGIDNCALGLKPLVTHAEKKGIILTMELLNSKRDHVGYQCDRTEWGVQLCKTLDSNHFKLLYDIYHMQIMEGDVIATIQEFHPYFSHYHTGGVPGRNEINETQELYYPAIMQAIAATGFKGFVAQEFIPTTDNPLESLKESIRICDV